jgi:hypothetical protein
MHFYVGLMQVDIKEPDTGFKLVTSKKPPPKNKQAVDDQQHMKLAFVMTVQVHFPMVWGSTKAFNPLAHVKAVLEALCMVDANISIQP